jgi:hypothetical protein
MLPEGCTGTGATVWLKHALQKSPILVRVLVLDHDILMTKIRHVIGDTAMRKRISRFL